MYENEKVSWSKRVPYQPWTEEEFFKFNFYTIKPNSVETTITFRLSAICSAIILRGIKILFYKYTLIRYFMEDPGKIIEMFLTT